MRVSSGGDNYYFASIFHHVKSSSPYPPITHQNKYSSDMSLDQLRLSIEEKDHAIITLISERMKIVQDIACEKERLGLPVRVPDQANAVLDRAARESERLDLDPAPVREIFQILVRMSEEFQEEWREKKE